MPDAFTPYCSTFEVHHIPLQPHAAAMSKRRCKHVLHSALQDEVQPPTGRQSIVRALGSRGGNHVEVEFPDGRRTLAMLPARFNKKLWVRRGGYLIVDEAADAAAGAGAVSALIVHVLYAEGVRALRKLPGVWPEEFAAAHGASGECGGSLSAAGSAPACAQSRVAFGGAPVAGSQSAAGCARAADEGAGSESGDSGSGSDGLPPLQANSNRRAPEAYAPESESDASESGLRPCCGAREGVT